MMSADEPRFVACVQVIDACERGTMRTRQTLVAAGLSAAMALMLGGVVAAQDEAEPPASGEARTIDIVADETLQFTRNGEKLTDIAVTPGETVIFRVDNTAGFAHNFYIGQDDELMAPSATTDVGIPDWESGVMELEWVVPDDITGLKFGCTVPGHYPLMQGTFSVGG
jgi:uncharacterized cupredoxin-like copper-binding protein